MNKCIGCGIATEKELCERCFRIKNYNDYKVVVKDNHDFIPILEQINKTNDLVLLVVDLFNIKDLSEITKYIHNDILLVLTKRDLLPDVYEDKILNYDYGVKCVDEIIISSNKNYQFDLLIDMIRKYKKSNNVYVVGYTNSGKSTMINKLIYNYSSNTSSITTSPLPNTTLNTIEVVLDDDLILFDTPGLLDIGDITNYVTGAELKRIIPNKKIRPITYQIKGKQTIIVDKYLRIEASDINLTLYLSNSLKIDRYYKDNNINKDLKKHIIKANNNDIVIKGLGFIKANGKGTLNIYTLDNVSIFTRNSLI